jgi:hypothetical protein
MSPTRNNEPAAPRCRPTASSLQIADPDGRPRIHIGDLEHAVRSARELILMPMMPGAVGTYVRRHSIQPSTIAMNNAATAHVT